MFDEDAPSKLCWEFRLTQHRLPTITFNKNYDKLKQLFVKNRVLIKKYERKTNMKYGLKRPEIMENIPSEVIKRTIYHHDAKRTVSPEMTISQPTSLVAQFHTQPLWCFFRRCIARQINSAQQQYLIGNFICTNYELCEETSTEGGGGRERGFLGDPSEESSLQKRIEGRHATVLQSVKKGGGGQWAFTAIRVNALQCCATSALTSL